uniref:Taste receptor type 2 n=1 Tax=Strongyloides venezuelensis TaxID=75913 RepID=A0A0K0FK51_STRVS
MLHGINLTKFFAEQYQPLVNIINIDSTYSLTILYAFLILLQLYLFTSCCCNSIILFLSSFLNLNIIYYVKRAITRIIAANLIISLIPCWYILLCQIYFVKYYVNSNYKIKFLQLRYQRLEWFSIDVDLNCIVFSTVTCIVIFILTILTGIKIVQRRNNIHYNTAIEVKQIHHDILYIIFNLVQFFFLLLTLLSQYILYIHNNENVAENVLFAFVLLARVLNSFLLNFSPSIFLLILHSSLRHKIYYYFKNKVLFWVKNEITSN